MSRVKTIIFANNKPKAKKRIVKAKEIVPETPEEKWISEIFYNLMLYADKITQAHIRNRNGHAWPIHQQLMHNTSELGEAYEAIRQGRCHDEIMQEFIDVTMASLTNLNIWRATQESTMTDEQFKKYMIRNLVVVMRKLTKRLSDKKYKPE